MKKIIIIGLYILLLIPIALATTIDIGSVFWDGTYNYTARVNFNVTTLNVTVGEIYIDDIPFCTWGRQDYFTTLRQCPPGAGAGAGASGSVTSSEILEGKKEAEELAELPFLDRLFSTYKNPNDGICDDGEWFLMDDDCNINIEDLREGIILRYMWFLRVILALGVIMLFRKSPNFPAIVIVVIALLALNGAFGAFTGQGLIEEKGGQITQNIRWVIDSIKENQTFGIIILVLMGWLFLVYSPNKKKRLK